MNKANNTGEWVSVTQKEYDLLPGAGAAALLNTIGDDGQPILKYAQCTIKGKPGIVKYWIDEEGKSWKRASLFIPGEKY